ncbi:hypothetical protein F2Q70_00020760 [Brassica cretica]|uniref:Uncharacterized protein n=1 Tax=Brassica cretica TaxID=69181 RepID=A0A8S9GXE9_BRACR|nr:hypothetical protein F2Q70_00020760 [Brassica cretica]
MAKAIPWPLNVGIADTMAKTNVVEKDETVPFAIGVKIGSSIAVVLQVTIEAELSSFTLRNCLVQEEKKQ